MDQDLNTLFDKEIHSPDGSLGRVKDFVFDAYDWVVRYLVVDTGTWMSERQILLPPHALLPQGFGSTREAMKKLEANVTRKDIEESPAARSHHLISRAFEKSYYAYFGWSPYWLGGGLWGETDRPEATVRPIPAIRPEPLRDPVDDLHLRRIRTVFGYRLQAADRTIGKVCSVTLNGYSWAIRDWVAQIGPWYARKQVFILPENIERIGDSTATVFLNLSPTDIEETRRDCVVETGRRSLAGDSSKA